MRALILALFTLLVQSVAAQQKDLSADALLAIIKRYHPVAKQAALDVNIASAELTASRGQFDPVFNMGNARKEFGGLIYYNQQQTEIKIPTWYGIDVVAGQEELSGERLNPEETRGTLTYVGLSMPLVQNLVMDKRRAAVRLARSYRDLSEVQRRIALNDLLHDALRAYWEWWEQYYLYQLIRSARGNAERRFQMVRQAYIAGDRPAIDTLEAYTQIQSFVIRESESFTDLAKARLTLSVYLWRENDEQYDLPADVVPRDVEEEPVPPLEAMLSQAERHPELTQYRFKLDMLRIERSLKFQLLLPEVYLKYNQLGYDISRTIKGPWFQQSYRYGISVSMPLRLSEGRGEFRKAKLKIERTQLEQINKQVLINNKVNQYYTEWQQTTLQTAMQKRLAENTASLQRGEEIRFQNGESSLFLVNSRELKTIETEQKLIQIRAKNRSALADLRWSAGLLFN
ncbi:MAG TPA: TolC family protein [Flavisolibacter sp.]|nr:TolC family protein [Flavisolibacter sp.]